MLEYLAPTLPLFIILKDEISKYLMRNVPSNLCIGTSRNAQRSKIIDYNRIKRLSNRVTRCNQDTYTLKIGKNKKYMFAIQRNFSITSTKYK